MLQVGLTDNAPIYILGGVIMPLGEGGMVTDAARNSSLTLVVRSQRWRCVCASGVIMALSPDCGWKGS